MPKMVDLYHNKENDVLKLGCTLPTLQIFVFTCQLPQSFFPSQRAIKLSWEKYTMIRGPSIVLTRKAVVHEVLIFYSSNWCKTILRIDTSQLYP